MNDRQCWGRGVLSGGEQCRYCVLLWPTPQGSLSKLPLCGNGTGRCSWSATANGTSASTRYRRGALPSMDFSSADCEQRINRPVRSVKKTRPTAGVVLALASVRRMDSSYPGYCALLLAVCRQRPEYRPAGPHQTGDVYSCSRYRYC